MAFLIPRDPLTPALQLATRLDPSTRVIAADDLFALREASQIVSDARRQAEHIVGEAEAAFASERQRGYQEGREEAKLDQAEQMIENISQTVDYFGKVEGKMVELVMRAVRKIINDFDDEDRVLIAVKSALTVVRNQKQIALRIHPQQAETVKLRVNEILAAYPGIGYLDIVADNRLKPDSCIVESEIGMIEASLEGQLEAMRAAFEKVLGSRI